MEGDTTCRSEYTMRIDEKWGEQGHSRDIGRPVLNHGSGMKDLEQRMADCRYEKHAIGVAKEARRSFHRELSRLWRWWGNPNRRQRTVRGNHAPRVNGSESKYHYTAMGCNVRPAAIQAAALLTETKGLVGLNQARRRNAGLYETTFLCVYSGPRC